VGSNGERRARCWPMLPMHLADAHMRAAEEARREAEGGEADDPDRVATVLMEKLKAAGTRKGSGVWDVFKAVGEARSDLVGVKSRPKQGTPTIAQVTCTTRPVEEGGGRAVVGVRAVAEEVARQAAALHQERGGSAEGMAAVYRCGRGSGAGREFYRWRAGGASERPNRTRARTRARTWRGRRTAQTGQDDTGETEE